MERIVIETRPEVETNQEWRPIPLDTRWIRDLDEFIKSDASVQCAFECLNRFLTGGGIHVRKRFWKASDYFNRILNTTYARICRDVIRSELAFGLVLIGLREDAVPFVYDLTTLSITVLVHATTNAYRYRVMPFGSDLSVTSTFRPLSNIIGFEVARPDQRGRVCSTLSTLYPMAQFTNSMIACAGRSEERRAVPPLITEARETKLEEKQFQRDYFTQGDNTAIHRQRLSSATAYGVTAAEEREWRSRTSQANLGSSGSAYDPVSLQRRYPVDLANGMSVPIPIEEGRTLVTNTPSESPTFLMELLAAYEADVGKVMGVPVGLWGSQRSPVAVDMTIMTVFNAALQVRRTHLQYVLNDLLEWVYGEANASHAALHYDPSMSLEDTAAAMSWDISFPGLLDPDMINMIMEQGYMEWDKMRPYVSSYFGIPLDCIAKERLDPMTGRPMAEVAEEQLKLEQTQIKTGIQEQKAKTIALGGRLSDRAAPGSAKKRKPVRDKERSQKSQATKKTNLESKKLAKKPKLRD